MQPYTQNYSNHIYLSTYVSASTTRKPRDSQPQQTPQIPYKVVKRADQTPEPDFQDEPQTQPERLFFTSKPIPFNQKQPILTQPAVGAIRNIERTYHVLYRQFCQIPPIYPDYFRRETLNIPNDQNQYTLNHFDVQYRDRTPEWSTDAIKDYRKYGFGKYDELRRQIHTKFTQFLEALDKYNISLLYAVDSDYAIEYQYENRNNQNLDWTQIAEVRSKTTIDTNFFLYVIIFFRRIMLVLNHGKNTAEIGFILGIIRVSNPSTPPWPIPSSQTSIADDSNTSNTKYHQCTSSCQYVRLPRQTTYPQFTNVGNHTNQARTISNFANFYHPPQNNSKTNNYSFIRLPSKPFTLPSQLLYLCSNINLTPNCNRLRNVCQNLKRFRRTSNTKLIPCVLNLPKSHTNTFRKSLKLLKH